MEVPLYGICRFSLVAFNIFFFVFNFCQSDCYVSWYIPPWVYPVWDSALPRLGCLFPFPYQGTVQLLSFQIFPQVPFLSLFSFWGPYNASVGLFNVVSEVSQTVSISFHFCFSILFHGSDFHYFVSRSLMHSSVSVILVLIPFSLFFISAILLFISVLQFFQVFVKHLLYPLDPCFHSFSKILDHLHYHYSELLLLILFLVGCLSLLHLVVFLGFHLFPSSGACSSAI